MKKILIIEDDPTLQKSLQSLLSQHYSCETASSLQESFSLIDAKKYELVIVDRMLPDGDGLEVIEYLHDSFYQTKVLALTHQSAVDDRIHGLEQGADEYLAKPFSFTELKLKVKKLLWMEKLKIASLLKAGSLEFNPETGIIFIENTQVRLRKKEAEIFRCLLRYKNQVVSRDMIIDDVWAGSELIPSETTLDVYIRRIRVLLKEYHRIITTVRGFGYCLKDSQVNNM